MRGALLGVLLCALTVSVGAQSRLRFVLSAIPGTPITTSDTIQTMVTAGSEGQTFVLQPGVHRMQSVTSPKNNQTFVGLPGAVMSGAKVVSSWTHDAGNSRWYADGQTQEGAISGECRATHPRCDRPDDVFRDNVVLVPVAALGDGGTGEVYFDYAANRIYIWDDPTGHLMEASVTDIAFSGTATGVTIRNLTIEKYAGPPQYGVIRGNGSGWTLEGNEVRWNHGGGISLGPSRTIHNNNVHHNGQMGILGSGSNTVVSNNEIAYNNALGFDYDWEAGGTKFTFSDGLLITGNNSHHNCGVGLWADIDNINVIFEYNTVWANCTQGIMHEISYAAIIRYNTIYDNGTDYANFALGNGWIDGAGIEVADSKDVQVYGNTLTNNRQGITAIDMNRGLPRDPGPYPYDNYDLLNLDVHDNTVYAVTNLGSTTGRSGIAALAQTPTPEDSSRNNHFENNDYFLGVLPNYFMWLGSDRNESQWMAYGNDDTGSFNR